MPSLIPESARTLNLDGQEAILVRQAKEGDTASFGELVHRYEKTVYGVVSRMIESRDEVDDLVQEVFLCAWKGLSCFRGDAKFSTWLHTIAVNTTLKRLKWLKRRQAVSIDDDASGLGGCIADSVEVEPFEQVSSAEEKAAVRSALSKLPDKHRIVVTLYYFEECSCDEIARIMGCSVGTVWSRLHYACKKLKNELNEMSHITEPVMVPTKGQVS